MIGSDLRAGDDGPDRPHGGSSDAPHPADGDPGDASAIADPTVGTTDGGSPGGGEPPAKEPRRYRGRTPDERRLQRRRRLLDAALDLFATAGYSGTSVERLCSTSGVTGRHFYEEFPSREALLTALYDEIIGQAFEAVATAVATAPPALGPRLDAGVDAYVHHLLDDPRRARIVTLEIVGVSAELEQHRREAAGVFAAFMAAEADALSAAGQRFQGNELTILALVAAVHELTAAWLLMATPIPIDEVVREAVRIITVVAIAAP